MKKAYVYDSKYSNYSRGASYESAVTTVCYDQDTNSYDVTTVIKDTQREITSQL